MEFLILLDPTVHCLKDLNKHFILELNNIYSLHITHIYHHFKIQEAKSNGNFLRVKHPFSSGLNFAIIINSGKMLCRTKKATSDQKVKNNVNLDRTVNCQNFIFEPSKI